MKRSPNFNTQKTDFITHVVGNQPPEYCGFNAWNRDRLLQLIGRDFAKPVLDDLEVFGQWAGSREAIELGRLANVHVPELITHDAHGHRIDRVEFHPAYHELMGHAVRHGMHNSIWDDGDQERGYRYMIRAARYYMSAGVEAGHLCPITMTNAAVAAIQGTPYVARQWLSRIQTRLYDPRSKASVEKSGVTIGMGMTEKQGGSDVRSNTTTATKTGDGLWQLCGHKWFMSAPMCDAFLMLAQCSDKDGSQQLSCFLVPRILPDGSNNGLRFQRLKNKLGNRSNASSEVEFDGVLAHMLGEQGKGIATILEMVTLTRLDCVVASAGLMRAALGEAVHHCKYRKVFGAFLIDQPLMTRVLADMMLDVAAATALAMRLARAFDRAESDPAEAAYARLMTPVIKYWVCKICPSLIGEAMEVMGGNGYVEDGNLARHYREAPLNAIWEGSGNVMCIDVIRVMAKDKEILPLILSMLEGDLDAGAGGIIQTIRTTADSVYLDPGSARILTEQLALSAAAAEMKRLGTGELAEAFINSRLRGRWRSTYGMLDNRYDARKLLDQWVA